MNLKEWGRQKPLLALYVTVFVDLFAVGIIVPLLPYYVSSVGAEAKVYGLLISIYGAAQLVGSPFMGKISDTYGRKAAFMISHAGTSLGYLMTGYAGNVWMLICSRVPVGLVKQTMSISKATISDISEEESRAKNIGLIHTAAGIGFTVAPLLGGLISSLGGQRAPAVCSALLFAANFLFVWLVFPDSEHHRRSAVENQRSIFSRGQFRALINLLQTPVVGSLIMSHFFFSLGVILFRSNFAIYVKEQFELDPKQNGFIMSYIGVLEVLTQMFAIGILSKRFSEAELIFGGCFFSAMSLLAVSATNQIYFFLVILLPMVVANSVTGTCIASALTKTVKKDEVGVTIGISDSTESIGRILSPTLGGLLMDYFGPSSPSLFGGIIIIMLSIMLWKNLPHQNQIIMGEKVL
eukprot:TRINITY_DN6660_c0_g1_i1.p1 TRINITY_DN6660_c0_g1~~TRINITY_DN6660_c0_g1_i1.p1  ORF type:complete len:408 (-),score=52.44 TRINITY_DN6660_c0_g1_i1:124-1347(-)